MLRAHLYVIISIQYSRERCVFVHLCKNMGNFIQYKFVITNISSYLTCLKNPFDTRNLSSYVLCLKIWYTSTYTHSTRFQMSIYVRYAKICPAKRADHTAWMVVLYFQTTCLRIVKISVPLYFGILYFDIFLVHILTIHSCVLYNCKVLFFHSVPYII